MNRPFFTISRGGEAELGDDPLQGSLLGGSYRVGAVLGRGGMSTVFAGEHVRLKRPVAIKVLARHLVGDAAALERFHREAEIVSQLSHPNVVQLFDFDTTDSGEPYLVMEYLSGRSLATVLEEYGRLDVQKAARIVHQVACGLQAAHRASVIHCDLKPANVFLVEVPDEGTLVKLLDFGIGKFVDTLRRPTGEHEIIGTPDYMAPEQALGQTARIDRQADQYSLAVIAFEAISGHVPFGGNSVAEVLDRVITNEPLPIERFVPEVPSGVGRVLRRGMAKEPEDRFDNVLDFAAALLVATGCTLPPPEGSRAPLRPLFEDGSTPPPRSFVAPRPDGRYYTQHDVESEAAPTEPPGPYPETEPPSSAPATEPPFDSDAPIGRAGDSARLPDVDRVLDQAREAFGLGDVNLAVRYAESALNLAAVLGGRSRERLEDATTLLESVFASHLGSLDARLVARRAASEGDVRLSPEEAFLLSRLDAPASVEEILDVSPLPRRETLRSLSALLRHGLVHSAG